MAQRARKYRKIKKRVKAYMKELLKKDSERVNLAMESYLKNVTYQRNDTNDFYEVVENNNENVDSNNCTIKRARQRRVKFDRNYMKRLVRR